MIAGRPSADERPSNVRRAVVAIFVLLVASSAGCGKEEPKEDAEGTLVSAKPEDAPVFTVKEPSGAGNVEIASLTAGTWTGTTTGHKQWLRVSFDVNPSEAAISNIKVESGLEGETGSKWNWTPEGATAAINPDGSFEFEDEHGNAIQGKFAAPGYASGTLSEPFFQVECADGKFRTPPASWRTAPE